MYVSRRVLDRFGYYMIASIEALHYASEAVTASSRSGVRAVDMLRCRNNVCATPVS